MLSWHNRFVFCFPAVAANLLWVFNDYTNYYYVQYLNLDTDVLSTATAFNGAAVFLLSPIVAFLSDRRASKTGGQRKGMLVLFALLYSLSQVPLVWLPAGLTDSARESWVTVVTIISSIFNAAFELNWAALSMTISNDFRERTLLFGMVNTIGSLAAIAGYAVMAVLPLNWFVWTSVVLGAANFLSYAWAASILGIKTSELHAQNVRNYGAADHATGNSVAAGSGSGTGSTARTRVRVTLAAGPTGAAVLAGGAPASATRAQRTSPRLSAAQREIRTRAGSPLSPMDGAADATMGDADEPPNASAARYHEIPRREDSEPQQRHPSHAHAHTALLPPATVASDAATAGTSAVAASAAAGAINVDVQPPNGGVGTAEDGAEADDETAGIPRGESGPNDEDDDAAAAADADAEDDDSGSGDELPIVPTLIRTFRNYPFLILFATQTLAYIDPLGPRSQLMKSYAFNAPQKVMALTSTLEMVVVAAATPVFVWCASKWGKKFVYMFLIIGWAAVTMGLVLFVDTYENPMYWVLELGTAIFGDTQTVFAQSLLADVVDYDHLIWGGSKRAAIYSCVLSDGQGLDQITDALQYGLMAAVGFHTSDDSASPRVQRGFRLICFFSAVPSIIAFFVFTRYPLSRERHREVLKATKKRLKGEIVVDPLTKTELPRLEVTAPSRRVTESIAEAISGDDGRTRAVALAAAVVEPPGPTHVVTENQCHQSGLDFFSLWELRHYLTGGTAAGVRCVVRWHMAAWACVLGAAIGMIVYFGVSFDLLSIFVSAAAIAIAFEYLHVIRYRAVPTLEGYSAPEIALHIDYVSRVLNAPLPASFKANFLRSTPVHVPIPYKPRTASTSSGGKGPTGQGTGSSTNSPGLSAVSPDKQLLLPSPPQSYVDPSKAGAFAPLPPAANSSWLSRPEMRDTESLLRDPNRHDSPSLKAAPQPVQLPPGLSVAIRGGVDELPPVVVVRARTGDANMHSSRPAAVAHANPSLNAVSGPLRISAQPLSAASHDSSSPSALGTLSDSSHTPGAHPTATALVHGSAVLSDSDSASSASTPSPPPAQPQKPLLSAGVAAGASVSRA